MKKGIILIITSVIFGIGFYISGILTRINTNYNIGVALGFMIGVFEMLLIFNLSKIYPSKRKKTYYSKKDTKALKVLTELVLTDDSEMSNKLIRRNLAKIKEIYDF